MAQAGPILETIPGHWRPEERNMSRDPRHIGSAGRPRVSVFGSAAAARRPNLDDHPDQDLRSALLPVLRSPEHIWAGLPSLLLDPEQAAAAHLIVSHREDPVGLLHDRLRTRLLQVLTERDWRRVGITAPLRGCGASTVAVNLALSLARRPSGRTVLMDMDLRHPALATILGQSEVGRLRDVLAGLQSLESHFLRLGRTLALGLNDRSESDSAELLQEPRTAEVLEQMIADMAPDAVLYDLPPLLDSDDVLGFLPRLDGILLVVDASRNTAQQIRDCERLLEGRGQIIGVVLNRAEDSPARRRWWGG